MNGSYCMICKPAHQRELKRQISDSNGNKSFIVPVQIEDLHLNAQSEIQELFHDRNNCGRPPFDWTVATILDVLGLRTLKKG